MRTIGWFISTLLASVAPLIGVGPAAAAGAKVVYQHDAVGNVKCILDVTTAPDTLVVRVNYPDVRGSASESIVSTRIAEADGLLRAISYGRSGLQPLFLCPVQLREARSWYLDPSRSLLIELVKEVLQAVDSGMPTLLDGPTPAATDDIRRVIIILNDPSFALDQATTGTWPYRINGKQRNLSVSVHGPNDTTEQYVHGLSHHEGLRDLYLYDNVTADPSLVDAATKWDNMAKPFLGAHPLVWSKELAAWVINSGRRVEYIPRPVRGGPPRTGQPPIRLSYQTASQSGDAVAIAVGLTEGVTALANESHFYWIEARKPGLGPGPGQGLDTVPSKGVLVYYANNAVPQGQAPIVVRDATPATQTRDDAPLQATQSLSVSGTGVVVTVDSELPGNDGFLVRVDYAPPPSGYDVSIATGDPPWMSPDIWVDNQRDGGGFQAYDDVAMVASAGPGTEQPIAKEVNRIYARIHNAGPAVAHDVEVAFTLSDPYHTVGGAGDFSPVGIKIIPTIPPGEFRDVYFEWTPTGADDPHSCIRVELRSLLDDTNSANNTAQRNVSVQQSRTRSPYTEVEFDFSITNSSPEPSLVYFRADEIPPAWSHHFQAESAVLTPGQRYIGKLIAKPNDAAPACTTQDIQVTGWTPRGDTLVRLGGTTLRVELRRTATIDVAVRPVACGDGLASLFFCGRIKASGCTDPPRPNQVVSVRYMSPTGQSVWRDVRTDAAGCFEDFYTSPVGGPWEVTAHSRGDVCESSATKASTITLPSTSGGGDDRRREWGVFVEYLGLAHKLGIRSPWMIGGRYALGVTSNWSLETEISLGQSKDRLGVGGRIWQWTAHTVYEAPLLRPLGWSAFAMAGVGVLGFDGFTTSARGTTADLGVGLKVPLAQRVSLRGDLRLVRAASVYGSGASNNFEATLGVSVRF